MPRLIARRPARLALLALFACVLPWCCLFPAPAAIAGGPVVGRATGPIAPAPNQRQMRVFQKLWSLVRDGYVYPDYNGVDWNAKKAEMEALINGGLSDGEFYFLMRKLVESLNDHHSAFLPPYAAEEIYELYFASEESSGVGLLTAVSQGRDYLYVLQVVPGSPAERAGIRAHDHILHIGGYPSVDRDGYSQSFLFLGPAGSEVPVEVRAPGGDARSMSLAREKLPQAAFVEARLLDNPAGRKIGYLLVPTFFAQDADRRAREGLQRLMAQAGGKLDGLVVDLRINSGGALTALRNTVGLFAQGALGQFVNRRGARSAFSAAGRPVGNSLSAPLVVLIGRDTESAAEVFAGALQARGRARLAGQPSAGNIELVRSHALEDGSLAFIAEQRFVLPDGRTWEGAGLAPDVAAGGAWDTFTAESDAALQSAVNLLAGP
jgi:C-terminal peptidase prc